MTGIKNKQIARLQQIRQILIFAAMVLSLVTAVSGFCFFRNLNAQDNAPASTEPTMETTVEPSEETTAWSTEEATAQPAGETLIPEGAGDRPGVDKLVPYGYPEEAHPYDDKIESGNSESDSSGAENPGSNNAGSNGSRPETSEPETSAPETSAPETSAPETPEPETPEPETPEPETPEPEVPVTEGSATDGDSPENIVPDGSGTESEGNDPDVGNFQIPTPGDDAAGNDDGVNLASCQTLDDVAQTIPAEAVSETLLQTEVDILQEYAEAEESSEALSAGYTKEELQEEPGNPLWLTILFFGSAGLLLADGIAICVISAQIQKLFDAQRKDTEVYNATEKDAIPVGFRIPAVGRAHDIGMRSYQQDSFGQIPVLNDQGLLAVVADGMGGLSDGEKVSQRIVMKALDFGVRLKSMPNGDTMIHMVNAINQDINQILGEENLFKSGSTLVATMVVRNQLWWASVGDSRIYLYRNGYLNQLTQDHDLLQEWMGEVSRGRMTYEQVKSNPDGRKLTSFIGMGKLRYIGNNSSPIALYPGDRILLMSDGVYGTVGDEEMVQILKAYPNVQEAADTVSRRIENAKRRHQDNYTIMILGI